MSKQTAVDWLLEQMKSRPMTIIELDDIFYQAKKLEREQIMEAHDQGYADGYRDNGNSPTEYYEQTYGGNNESN